MADRYLGSGTIPEPHDGLTGPVPAHLPQRLTITLWDFSWYTRAGVGDLYEDLEAAVADAASLGYNAIRICAAPLLLFGGLGLDALAADLEIEGLGAAPDAGFYGRRTRWYDVPGGFSIDLRARLLDLFAAAERHGVVIILASWEYQQSPAFAASGAWFEAIDAVPLADRYRVLADAWDRMLAFLTAHGHRDRVALVELHNEIDFSILPALADGGVQEVRRLRAEHPDLLITASYGKPPHLAMHRLPDGSAPRSSTSTATVCSTPCRSGSTSAPRGVPTSRTRRSVRCSGRMPRARPSTDARPSGSTAPPSSPTR